MLTLNKPFLFIGNKKEEDNKLEPDIDELMDSVHSAFI